MKPLADHARKTITALAGPGWRDGLTLLEHWPEIAGPATARLCSPQQVRFPNNEKRDGTLVLAAPGAARLELQHQTPHILSRVNQFFGYAAIAKIQLVPGELPTEKAPAPAETTPEIGLNEALERLRAAIRN
ncbi:MAG: DUF721 domain-containing protein [Bdellovibrionales bacterium]